MRIRHNLSITLVLLSFIWANVPDIAAEEELIRRPAVAGTFYPAASDKLRSMVDKMLAEAPRRLDSKPRLLIAPHASYVYSGPMAARAFKQVEGHAYDAVVVVALSHSSGFSGASVDTVDAYATPLGPIPLDAENIAWLKANAPQGLLHHKPALHAGREHSLEVMLPFLQQALGEFRLIPILMGTDALPSAKQLAELLFALSERGDYLFVFSSDLSHYHGYEKATSIDSRATQLLSYETPEALYRAFQRRSIEACGRGPLVTALALSERMGYLKRTFLGYANSGDTAGDRDSVVGYTALAFSESQSGGDYRVVSEEAGRALVRFVRWKLNDYFEMPGNGPMPDLEAFPELQQSYGTFVTLRKKGALRGCIGRIRTEAPLVQSIPVVALQAALKDARFPPLQKEELDAVTVEVSILSEPKKVSSYQEIVPGRDGVVLEFRGRSGVFLPQVWEDTGWTREEFLGELAHQKAGLPGQAWQHADLFTFRDQVFEE